MGTENFAEEHRNIGFENAVTFELRQKAGLLYPLVGGMKNYSGSKAHRIDNVFDELHMAARTTRNGNTNLSDIDSRARWIKSKLAGDVGTLIDDDDQKVTEVSLGDPLAMAVAKAARRWHDDEWLLGYFGDAWEGETGDTAVPFDSGNVVGHGSVGLTKAKLIDMQEMMALNDLDTEEEMPILLISPKQKTDLMGITEYVNADYNDSKPLVRNELKPWLGFRFIQINFDSTGAYKRGGGLTLSGSTRRLPCFQPSGLHRGVWTEFQGDIGPRRDKGMAQQIYGKARSAVTRLREEKCYILECTEA